MALSEFDKDFSRSYALSVVHDPIEIPQVIDIDDPIVTQKYGMTVVPGRVPWPANDATAKLLTYYMVEFPEGANSVSVPMLAGGVIATAHLGVTLTDEAKAALANGLGSKFIFLDEVVPTV